MGTRLTRPLGSLLLAAGSAVLVALAVKAMSGHLWAYEWSDFHRFTSRAMLSGDLYIHRGLQLAENDEQVYGGAGYTNWGFGVPLLQLPFQAIARAVRPSSTPFFPDRAIYFVYLVPLLPLLWVTLGRVLAERRPVGRRLATTASSFAATALLLACAVFPLMAYRFHVYEETIAYLVVFELYALCAWVYARRSGSLLPVAALAVAAGLGLVIRATGVVYAGVWAALLLFEPRRRARLATYAAVIAPFAVFLLATNAAKSGSALSFGYANSVPYYDYHIPIQRFGSQCADSLEHGWEVAWSLLRAFFWRVVPDATAHLKDCHFTLEMRESEVSGWWPTYEPFFGLPVLLFLGGVLGYHLRVRAMGRRGSVVPLLVPFAALAALFGVWVHGAIGFVWRYAGDFWPLIALVFVQWAERAPARVRAQAFGWPAAAVFAVLAFAAFRARVVRWLDTVDVIPVGTDSELAVAWRFDQGRQPVDWAYPSHVARDHVFPRNFERTKGWQSDGSVGTFTNLYVGVPPPGEARHRYRLHVFTAGFDMPWVRVYANGRIYAARYGTDGPEGPCYRVDLDLDYDALTTPAVMVTVEWTHDATVVPQGKLMSVEII
jgi:hypothetical protein